MAFNLQHPNLVASDAFVTDKWNMTVAELLLDYLKLEGVDTVFGIPGGAVIWIADELKKRENEFNFVICRHETGAAYIAHGYSLVSGKIGVVLTTSGPAATNAVTGAMNAQAAGVALLAITGEIPESAFGKGYLQEGIDSKLDVTSVFRNAVEFSGLVTSPSNFQTLMQQALRTAKSSPENAVHLSIPNNVGGECVQLEGAYDKNGNRIPFPVSTQAYRTDNHATDAAKSAALLDDLLTATRPLLFLGEGCRRALRDNDRLERLKAFCDKFAIPVMTTPDGKGIFPETDKMSLRNYGMLACKWPGEYMGPDDEIVDGKVVPGPNHFDVLAVFGSALGELATSVVARDHWSKMLLPTKSFTQIDLNQAMIARDYPITRGIVGDCAATLDAIMDAAEGREPPANTEERRAIIAEIKKDPESAFDDPDGRNFTGAPVHPAALHRVVQEKMSTGHIFIDAGNCVGFSLNNMVIDPPVRYHSALDMGPMGFGVGAVIGGKMADPDNPAVAIVGDGAFMMHGAEVSSAAQAGVGAIWVVLYNDDLAMVSQGMGALYPPPESWEDYYKLGAPDLAKYAEGLGADGYNIMPDDDLSVFSDALETAIQRAKSESKPQVISVHIDRKPMPNYGWPTLPQPDCGAKPAR